MSDLKEVKHKIRDRLSDIRQPGVSRNDPSHKRLHDGGNVQNVLFNFLAKEQNVDYILTHCPTHF